MITQTSQPLVDSSGRHMFENIICVIESLRKSTAAFINSPSYQAITDSMNKLSTYLNSPQGKRSLENVNNIIENMYYRLPPCVER